MQILGTDRLFLQGRVVAATQSEAIQLIEQAIRGKGYTPVSIKPYPCPVQPYENVWWEYQTEVVEGDKERPG